MGKIVKYCDACEESFAEKFGFCPICGESLKAFEMNPLENTAKTEAKASDEIFAADTTESYFTDQLEIPGETSAFPAGESEIAKEEAEIELDLSEAEESEIEEIDPIAKPKFAVAGAGSGFGGDASEEAYRTKIDYSNYQPIDSGAGNFYAKDEEDDFHVTVLTEKNVKERNLLFLGIMVIMVSLCFGVVIASIFNYPLLVGAIGDEDLVAFVPVVDEVPMSVEEEQQQKDDEEGGGGGGGGRDEETPTSKGRLPTQTEKPIIAPDTSIVQKNFELQQPVASTQGKKEIPPTEEPYGDPNGLLAKLSNGMGTGGGQGSGVGTGQGSGRGTGQGSGIGSGSGSGVGDGEGGGTGGGRGTPTERPKPPSGPTTGIRFISKPQPKYTDAARQNNVQGQVTLRITFLANGQIGSISPVKGLSYGLTEQAIAAARQIRFEPAMRNGQPYSVTKSVQYTFTIY